MKKYGRFILFWIFTTGIAGAESIRPASSLVTVPPSYQNTSEAQTSVPKQPWFKNVSDPLLDDIIAQVLEHNATINSMLATISRLKAEYEAIRANRYPRADLNITGGAFGSAAQSDAYYSASVPVSYEVDVWQRLRAQRQAAFSDVTVSKEDKMALATTLAAEAAEAYYRGLYLEQQTEILKQAVRIAEEIKRMRQKQYDSGLIAKEDYLRSEKEVREFSAAEADMEAQRIRTEHLLKTMMGQYPSDGWLDGDFIVPDYLAKVQVGLPADLVEQRPDVRAQQARLETAGFKIAAARRDRYPRLTLTAAGVKSSLDSQQLIDGVFGSWVAFASVSIPLLDGGRKQSEVAVQESRRQQALQEYKGILLQAFKEVEDALAGGEKQVQIVNDVKKHEESLQDIYELSSARYTHGVDTALIVKEHRLNVIRARLEREKAELQLISKRIQLLRALGGEW